MGYPVGRIVIENMRSDSANLILGQRVNTWVSILVFLLGVYLWRRFGRMEQPAAPGGTVESDGPEVRREHTEDPSVQAVPDRPNDTAPSEPKVDRPAQS